MDNNTNSLLIILLDEIDFENTKGIDEPKVSHLYEMNIYFDYYHVSIRNFNTQHTITCSFRS